MRLWEFPDRYVLEPVDAMSSRYLSISKASGDLEATSQLPVPPSETSAQSSIVYGLVGVVRLLAGTYALVITAREEVGTYRGAAVYRVQSMKFLSCNANVKLASAKEKKDEAHYLVLLKAVESTPGLYFSYEADLTLTAQRNHAIISAGTSQPLWRQADPRFLWNKHLLEEVIESKLEAFILPVIQGSFQTIQVSVGGKNLDIALISRRCIKRLGTRMWRRGADREGFAANFVESEQLVTGEDFLASFVQVRGSIPILWEQIVDLSYKPAIKAVDVEETPKIVERHFRDLSLRYGSILAVDLINQRGSEGVLGVAYADAMQGIVDERIRYVPFDFHAVCGHLHFERLSILYDQISDQLEEQGYFVSVGGEKVQEQKGVVRTNCIDCLDRTNVTQSLLGRKALEAQLYSRGVFGPTETITQHYIFNEKLKIMWANHGDDISIQYSGTGALKGDFVRCGRRTFFGLIQDGVNAIARYYLNNFKDGVRQDAMDLVLGHYSVNRNAPSPFELNGFESLAYLPAYSAVIVAGITLTSYSLRQVGEDASQFFYSVIWAGITAGAIALVKANGQQFCSRPRLCPLH